MEGTNIMLNDSGDRREFGTGAVRDMAAGGSDSQAYKQFGNAVTVSVAKANAMAIKDFLAKRVTQ